jgi:hypothetical protein
MGWFTGQALPALSVGELWINSHGEFPICRLFIIHDYSCLFLLFQTFQTTYLFLGIADEIDQRLDGTANSMVTCR